MPKLKPVTNEELAALIDKLSDVVADIADTTRRIEGAPGVSERATLTPERSHIGTTLAAAREAARLASALFMQRQLVEQQREIDAARKEIEERRAAAQ